MLGNLDAAAVDFESLVFAAQLVDVVSYLQFAEVLDGLSADARLEHLGVELERLKLLVDVARRVGGLLIGLDEIGVGVVGRAL